LAFDNGGSGDEEDETVSKLKQPPKNSTPIVKLKTKQVKKPSLNDLYADKVFKNSPPCKLKSFKL
jgi:hypothetical protein